MDIKTDEGNGDVCALHAVGPDDDLVIMSQGGQIMRTHVADVSRQGRNRMGVRVMRLDPADHVAGVDVVPAAALEADDAEDEPEDDDAEPDTASDQ